MGFSFDGLTPGGYGLIMADPPWTFKTWSDRGHTEKTAQSKYECQSLEWVQSLPVKDLAAEDCLLWLWATNPMLDAGIDTLKTWGFEFKTAGTWVKMTRNGKQAFGTGYILRCASEPFLIGTIGKPKTTRSTRTAIMGQVREHSRKPESAFDAAEKLLPDARRAELFSRQARKGWDCWGNEVEKFEPA